MNKPNLKSTLCTGGSLICEYVFKMLEITVFRSNSKHGNNAINEILFYGANDEKHTRQLGLNNLLCIYYIILHASRTVDFCVPSLSSDTLAKCLVSVQQKKKVNVRIAIHNSDDFHNLQLLAQNGIEVKVIKPGVRLEHEFVLVDAGAEDAVAVLGALDAPFALGEQDVPGEPDTPEALGEPDIPGELGEPNTPDALGEPDIPGEPDAGPKPREPARRHATLLTSDRTVLTALYREFERVWNSVSEITQVINDY